MSGVTKRFGKAARSCRALSLSPSADLNADGANVRSIAERVERLPHALTVRELTAILRVSDQTVYRMIADQTIPFLVLRGSYRFDPKEVAQWLRKKSVSAA